MYDLVIIGAGWAGVNAAIKAKSLGLKTAIIEQGQAGGTCLNLGCIPTKSLIQSAKILNTCKKASVFGINTTNTEFEFKKIQERKNKIVQQLRLGLEFMLKGIDYINSEAKLISPTKIQTKKESIDSKFILVACGSKSIELPQFKFDNNKILSSDDMLNLDSIPKSLLIIGGGVIGCEFASLFSNLGSKVSIVEKMPQLLPGEDMEVARKLENLFKKRNIQVFTSKDASLMNLNDSDRVLVAVGRKPSLKSLGLEDIGIKIEGGKVATDEYLATNIKNVYAAGDCTGGIMLAHYAAYQGVLAVKNISNLKKQIKLNSEAVPNCIFTEPEISSVGINENKARIDNIDFGVLKFDFLGSSMARIINETDGFIKIIFDKKTQNILGGSIIGPRATELIANLTLAISCHLTVEQLRDTIFAHPTISETLGLAVS